MVHVTAQEMRNKKSCIKTFAEIDVLVKKVKKRIKVEAQTVETDDDGQQAAPAPIEEHVSMIAVSAMTPQTKRVHPKAPIGSTPKAPKTKTQVMGEALVGGNGATALDSKRGAADDISEAYIMWGFSQKIQLAGVSASEISKQLSQTSVHRITFETPLARTARTTLLATSTHHYDCYCFCGALHRDASKLGPMGPWRP